jgi:hypothetical protein
MRPLPSSSLWLIRAKTLAPAKSCRRRLGPPQALAFVPGGAPGRLRHPGASNCAGGLVTERISMFLYARPRRIS